MSLCVSGSVILMVRAMFQLTCIMGTMDLTFFTWFHSKRSKASLVLVGCRHRGQTCFQTVTHLRRGDQV
uniref:Uncharacterized protein n=1 Tax=Anguilla anguilla TaxID=7936 RepID=A0A0E9T8T2_ANGAN